VPWIIGTSGWGLFIHQPYGTFDFSGGEGRFLTEHPDLFDLFDLFLVGAREPAAIMAEYAKLTGYPEMPPLWSLGYQQSHRTLASRDEILQEARTFREKKLPCDTMIYLGTGFCPSGWNTDNGEFTFNKNVFPDPPGVIQQLHDDHFKIVLHVVLRGHTVGHYLSALALMYAATADARFKDRADAMVREPVRIQEAQAKRFHPGYPHRHGQAVSPRSIPSPAYKWASPTPFGLTCQLSRTA
jgi:hypothetical protein